jgi:hypothetical protein
LICLFSIAAFFHILQELTNWLNATFVEMDQLLAHHAKNGTFPGEEYQVETTTFPLYMSVFWFVLHGLLWAWLVLRYASFSCAAVSEGQWSQLDSSAFRFNVCWKRLQVPSFMTLPISRSWVQAGNWHALGLMFASIIVGGVLLQAMIHYSRAKDKPPAAGSTPPALKKQE